MDERVEWREWGQQAFDLAAHDGRPILLDISAVWCHWCHVMDKTTYADPELAAEINRRFVPVKVDTDRRPDVNSRYNMGGWPSTVFLTPGGKILTGATYLRPHQMKKLLVEVADFYRGYREEMGKVPPEPEDAVGPGEAAQLDPGETARLDPGEALGAVEEVVAMLEQVYDPEHGGFGLEPKFPQVDGLRLLLVSHLRGGAEADDRLRMVERTLRAMRQGGLYDQVAGGFFRYSTTRDWSIPHYEKMLEDNAQLLGLYGIMARLNGDDFYLDTVKDVARYLATTLRSEEGYFFGSQDADEDYYRLDAAGRQVREAPSIDRTLYLGWNALAASGFLRAYLATDDVRLRETALVALEYAWAACRTGDVFVHYRDDDGPGGPVLLEDYARLALALLDAHEATGEDGFLERAGRVLEETRQLFGPAGAPSATGSGGGGGDGSGGGAFFDIARGGEDAGRLRQGRKGLDDNVILAMALLRHAELDGGGQGDDPVDHPDRRAAESILAQFLGPHRRQGTLAAGYALALDRWVGPTAIVDIAGERADEQARALRLAAAAAVTAAAAVRSTPGGEAGGEPLAVICSSGRCLAPLEDPAAMADVLRLAARRGTGQTFPPPGGDGPQELPFQPS